MPKAKGSITIKLNLLKPQSNPEKLIKKLIRWLLSSGRYVFVFVEAIVLIAFITRFKFDADLAAKKEAIEEQIPYIESLKPYETLIRETQLKLSTINDIRKNASDWSADLEKIAEQTPLTLKITSIKMAENMQAPTIRILGQVQSGGDLSSFITSLKGDPAFGNVALTSIGMDQGLIQFSLEISTKTAKSIEKSS